MPAKKKAAKKAAKKVATEPAVAEDQVPSLIVLSDGEIPFDDTDTGFTPELPAPERRRRSRGPSMAPRTLTTYPVQGPMGPTGVPGPPGPMGPPGELVGIDILNAMIEEIRHNRRLEQQARRKLIRNISWTILFWIFIVNWFLSPKDENGVHPFIFSASWNLIKKVWTMAMEGSTF